MKQRLAALLATLVLASCGTTVSDEVINGQAVATAPKAKDWNFAQYATYAISPTTVVHDTTSGTEQITTVNTPSSVVQAIQANMTGAGYRLATGTESPDLFIGLSAFKGNATYGGYYCDWYYWGYPYYCGYYPYGSYNYGTLVMSMGDFKNRAPPVGGADQPTVQTVWGAAMYSVLSTGAYNDTIAVTSINRAFAQSPYLHK